MNWANFRFCIVALLVLLAVGWARAQPVRVPDDSVASVTLENGQYLCNFGERLTRTKPLRVIRKGTGPGFVAHRPTATDPHGQTINLTLHGFAMRDWVFVAASGARYEPSAVYNAGVEEPTIENVVVDAPCSVAKVIWTTVDLWGIAVPHGPTLSGGNIVSMRLYGPGGVGFLAVGEVTDLYAGQISTSGSGPARFQFHAVPQYQWPQWSPAGQPKKPLATSEGRPKRIVFADTRMSEGSYVDGVVYSKQAEGLAYPSGYKTIEGPIYRPVMKVQSLGVATPGGGSSGGPGNGTTDNPPQPPPATQPSSVFVPLPEFGPRDVSTAPRQDWAGRSPSIGYFPVTLTGSPTAPAIINFAGTGNTKQRVPHKFYFAGSYAIINGLDAHKIEIAPGSHHVVIQNCRAGGDATRKGAGFAIGGSAAAPVSQIVLSNCEASDNGDWLANFDEDFHGVAIGGNTSYVWITGSKFWHNSGDAIQINAGSLANQGTLHHVYVTGCEMWENKQTGGATKQSRHVVWAGNYVHDHKPIGTSPSAWGAGFGHQYGAGPIWYIGNRIERCSFGIQSGSTSGLGDGQDAYYIFNTIADIRHDSGYAYNANTAWSNAALSLVGNPHKYAVGNTIRRAEGGVYLPGGVRVLVEGNIFADVTGQDVWLEDPANNVAFSVLSNLAWPSAELRKANQPQAWPIGNIVADPHLSSNAGQLRTWIPSPEAVAIFDRYQAEFGVDLRAFRGAAPWAIGAP